MAEAGEPRAVSREGPFVAGIVLAAGASTRMGRCKQLLPLPEGTLLGKAVTEALRSRLDRVVVVIGFQAARIRWTLKELFQDPKVKVVENRAYQTGMSSSLILGLKAVEAQYPHVLVMLGDMPGVDSRLIDLLIDQCAGSDRPMGAVAIRGRRSHPVIFSRRVYPELHRLQGDVGARELFRRHQDDVCLAEPPDGYEDLDVDTPGDYRRLLGRGEV